MHTLDHRYRLMIGGSAAAALISTVVAAGRGVSPAEQAAARWAYDLPPWSTNALEIVMQTGTRGAIVAVAVVLASLGRRRAGVVAVAAGVTAWLAAEVLKGAVGRPRPTTAALGRAVRDVAEGEGFPSSHAAIATALAVAVVLMVPLPRAFVVIGLFIALTTAVARVHIGVHWPVDVIGGASIGATTACLTAVLAGTHVINPARGPTRAPRGGHRHSSP